MNLEQGHEGIEKAGQIAMHQHHEGCPPGCHIWHVSAVGDGFRSAARLVDYHVDVAQIFECTFDSVPHIGPMKSPETAAQWRHRDRTDLAGLNLVDKSDEAGLDVFHPAFPAPVAFGRKIDDVFRTHHARLKYEHAPRLDLLSFASSHVRLEVVGEGILELKRDSSAHDSYTIYGVHQRLDVCR